MEMHIRMHIDTDRISKLKKIKPIDLNQIVPSKIVPNKNKHRSSRKEQRGKCGKKVTRYDFQTCH